ncbi:hypothetical protein Mhar_0313 [Methanothrix harundinacea 6Ac]|uniref:Uncharacterized protein n=1 Tax=Methanothrix harundinacea (strain 6Ac) TaxID=1110509 RepID=G7WLV7_METH6|nr:hypothetical protein Mhar_0313 [Methanothrix harundinacea 6Ac]
MKKRQPTIFNSGSKGRAEVRWAGGADKLRRPKTSVIRDDPPFRLSEASEIYINTASESSGDFIIKAHYPDQVGDLKRLKTKDRWSE